MHDWYWICHDCQPPGSVQRQKVPQVQSWLERQAIPVLVKAGHRFQPQFELGKFRFDFAIPSLWLLIETDGYWTHLSPRKKARDEAKASFAEDKGWKVVHIRNGPDLEGRLRAVIDLRQSEIYG